MLQGLNVGSRGYLIIVEDEWLRSNQVLRLYAFFQRNMQIGKFIDLILIYIRKIFLKILIFQI